MAPAVCRRLTMSARAAFMSGSLLRRVIAPPPYRKTGYAPTKRPLAVITASWNLP
jgi:hypothetical protein